MWAQLQMIGAIFREGEKVTLGPGMSNTYTTHTVCFKASEVSDTLFSLEAQESPT